MKSSYYQTPRTLRETTFHHWAEPIEYDEPDNTLGGTVALLIAVAICVAAVLAYTVV